MFISLSLSSINLSSGEDFLKNKIIFKKEEVQLFPKLVHVAESYAGSTGPKIQMQASTLCSASTGVAHAFLGDQLTAEAFCRVCAFF